MTAISMSYARGSSERPRSRPRPQRGPERRVPQGLFGVDGEWRAEPPFGKTATAAAAEKSGAERRTDDGGGREDGKATVVVVVAAADCSIPKEVRARG